MSTTTTPLLVAFAILAGACAHENDPLDSSSFDARRRPHPHHRNDAGPPPDDAAPPPDDAGPPDSGSALSACADGAAANGWSHCSQDASTCSLVFTDHTGCNEVCASLGLTCVQSYENINGECAANTSLAALGCADTGHGSDYCTCGDGTVVPDPDPEPDPVADGPIGFAAVAGFGVTTTVGGAGGRTVRATTASELVSYASSSEPLIIEIRGTIVAPSVRVTSNKTLVGIGPDALIRGGVRVQGSSASSMVSNVIIRNLTINALDTTESDALAIRYAHHVWVDHCHLQDAVDGLLDITLASDFVTVSWTKFSYPAQTTSHRLAMLIGASDTAYEDRGRLHITMHHNHWGYRVIERMPRVRFGRVHVFNNYYRSDDSNYCITAAIEASIVIENNHFDNTEDPHMWGGDPALLDDSEMVARGNLYTGRSATTRQLTRGDGFVPPYPYTLDPPEDLRAMVLAQAGPQ